MTRPHEFPARALAREIRLTSHPGEEGLPAYRRLYRQLREHILAGRLAPGARLPSARTLAADLRLSRNTIETAMAQLVDEGLVARRVGAGTRVTEVLLDRATYSPDPKRAHASRSPAAMTGRAPVPRADFVPAPRARLSARGEALLRLGRRELSRDQEFGPSVTNVRRFPLQAWTRMLSRRARRSGHDLLVSADPRGLPALRGEIAQYASLTRGLRCSPDQVLVVGSAQEALDLVARTVLDPQDIAMVEDPGYSGARAALLGSGAIVRAARVDSQGIVTGALPRRGRVRLVYVTPSHQFPLGVTMSLPRRMELLRWAAERAAMVIEDDYDSEFRYDGRPIAALQSLPGGARAIYVGTYNKVLFPGLKLAYLILPEPWVEPLVAARRITSGGGSPLLQAVLAEFISSGRFASYLRQARLYYARCRDRLVEAIRADWPEAVRLGPASTGLHVVARLPATADEHGLAESARRSGLPAVTLSACSMAATPPRGLIINYGSSNPDALAESARRFAPVLRRELANGTRRRVRS